MANFSLPEILKEARRRRVFRVAALYIVGAWVFLQAADLGFPALGIPDSAIRYVWLGALLAFPVAIIFGWRYDVVDGRVVRTVDANREIDLAIGRTDYFILGALGSVVAAIVFGLGTEIADTQNVRVQAAGTVQLDPNSIAVLPFVNMSADPTQDYFSDGMSAQILNALSDVRGINVVARASSFVFKEQNKSIPEIASLLGIKYVLDGSVFRSGDQIRITAQLVDADSGFNIWSDTYDRQAVDLFAIQDDIAQSIIAELRIHVLDEDSTLTVGAPTGIDAYDLYLLALEKRKGTTGAASEIATLLDQTLEIDPDFVEALALRAIVEIERSDFAFGARVNPLNEVLPRVEKWLDAARELDATAPETLHAIGLYHEAKEDVFTAETHYREALQQRPNYTAVRALYARTLGRTSRVREGISQLEEALTYDPANAEVNSSLFNWYVMMDELAKAEATLDRWEKLDPDERAITYHRVRYLRFAGQLAASLELIEAFEASEAGQELFGSQPSPAKGAVLLRLAEYERVIQESRRAEGGEPFEINALTLQGRHGEAVAAAERWRADQPTNRWAVDTLLRSLFYAGRWSDYVAVLEQNFEDVSLFRGDEYFAIGSVAFGPYEALEHPRFEFVQESAWSFLEETDEGGYGKPEIDIYAARLLVLDNREDEAISRLQHALDKNLFTPWIPIDPVLTRLSNRADYVALIKDIEQRINEQRAELDLPPARLARGVSETGALRFEN